jgi:hypothetical protein
MQLGKGIIDSLLHSSSNQQSKQSQLSSDSSLVDQILELEKKKYLLQRQKGQLDNHDLQYKLQQLQSEVSHLHHGNSPPPPNNERRRSGSFTLTTDYGGHPLPPPSSTKEERLAALLRNEKQTFIENDHFSDDDDSEDDDSTLFSYGSRQNSRNYSTEGRQISKESFTSSSTRRMSFGPSTGSGTMAPSGSTGATASMPASSSGNQPLHPLSNRLNYNKMVQQGTILPSSVPSSASSSSRPPSTASSSVPPPQGRLSLTSATVNGYTPPRLSTNIRTISKAASNDHDSVGSTALTSFLPPSSEEVIPRSSSEGRNKIDTRLSGDPDLLSGMRTSLADDFDLEFYDSLHQPVSPATAAELLSPSSLATTAAEAAAHMASLSHSSSSSQYNYHDSLLQNLLEFCIIEANWDELINKTSQFLTPTIPPKLQWRFPPIINEITNNTSTVQEQNFFFPSGVKVEMVSKAVMEIKIRSYNCKRHIVPFSDRQGLPLYACCLTVNQAYEINEVKEINEDIPIQLYRIYKGKLAAKVIQKAFRKYQSAKRLKLWQSIDIGDIKKLQQERGFTNANSSTASDLGGGAGTGTGLTSLNSSQSGNERSLRGRLPSLSSFSPNAGSGSSGGGGNSAQGGQTGGFFSRMFRRGSRNNNNNRNSDKSNNEWDDEDSSTHLSSASKDLGGSGSAGHSTGGGGGFFSFSGKHNTLSTSTHHGTNSNPPSTKGNDFSAHGLSPTSASPPIKPSTQSTGKAVSTLPRTSFQAVSTSSSSGKKGLPVSSSSSVTVEDGVAAIELDKEGVVDDSRKRSTSTGSGKGTSDGGSGRIPIATTTPTSYGFHDLGNNPLSPEQTSDKPESLTRGESVEENVREVIMNSIDPMKEEKLSFDSYVEDKVIIGQKAYCIISSCAEYTFIFAVSLFFFGDFVGLFHFLSSLLYLFPCLFFSLVLFDLFSLYSFFLLLLLHSLLFLFIFLLSFSSYISFSDRFWMLFIMQKKNIMKHYHKNHQQDKNIKIFVQNFY